MSKGVALVTGASRGIGKAIAIALCKNGYEVLINYTSNDAAAESTLKELTESGGKAELLKFNVADETDTFKVIEEWQNRNKEKHISVLINNAGIRKDNLLLWQTMEDWSSVINVSLNGFFNVTRAVLKGMMMKKFGRIINISSLSGIKGMAGQTNYAATKGGLNAATKSLALEVARKNITVNAVAPGFIKTDMTSELNEEELQKLIPMNRFGEAEEVAALIMFLASKEASYITGEVISINGGLYT
jgi:3-oxoacyl-[acyl-carrier protein] reductase